MTQQDFIDWKAQPMTKRLFESIDARIEDTKELLSMSAGVEPQEDNFRRGYIAACRAISLSEWEDAE